MAQTDHPAMKEILNDEVGQLCEARLLSTVRQLQSEGRETRFICHALLRAMMTVSGELEPVKGYSFQLRARDTLNDLVGSVEDAIDELELV